jgi:rare lipoprotein A
LKFIGNGLKNSLLWSFLFCLFLFTGCSQKNSDIDYGKFYKDTHNSKINNSKQMHKYTMRPYSVFGITYYPFIANIGDEFDGIASWYGPDFHSKKTSNGEIYNMYDMTAAHKTLPMNTVVKVDNLENGRSVIVRINDRGPFVRGRIIDLSNKAAHEIDMYRKGTAKVKVTVLGYNGEIENKDAPFLAVPKTETPTQQAESGVDTLEPLEIKEDSIKTTNVNTFPKVEKLENRPIAIGGKYNIQVGAFSKSEGALKVKNDYQKRFNTTNVESERVFINGKTLYKVFIKSFKTYEEAQQFKNANNLDNAIIINN